MFPSRSRKYFFSSPHLLLRLSQENHTHKKKMRIFCFKKTSFLAKVHCCRLVFIFLCVYRLPATATPSTAAEEAAASVTVYIFTIFLLNLYFFLPFSFLAVYRSKKQPPVIHEEWVTWFNEYASEWERERERYFYVLKVLLQLQTFFSLSLCKSF